MSTRTRNAKAKATNKSTAASVKAKVSQSVCVRSCDCKKHLCWFLTCRFLDVCLRRMLLLPLLLPQSTPSPLCLLLVWKPR